MKEDKDRLMEGLWLLYRAEGAPRNLSIEKLCMNNDVNYHEFYKWYKSMHHGVYQLQIDGTPDNIKATTLTAIPSKEHRINPHDESTHEVYTSGGRQVLMSEEAYELYKHQLDINYKMHQRIHDMEFNDKMKSFGCIELLVRFPDGTQIMGNAKDVPHAMAWFKRVGDSNGTRRIVKEDAAQTAVGEDGRSPVFFNGSILEYEQRSVSFSCPSSSQAE